MKELFNIVKGEKTSVQTFSGDEKFSIKNPANGDLVCQFSSTGINEIDAAVEAAHAALSKWSRVTAKQRAQIFFKFRSLCLEQYKGELVDLITLENGKHKTDATASLLKGLETCEYALGVSLGSGSIQEVSTGITCQDRRDPGGVIVSICPFNFPAMVPMWTLPILAVLGNSVIVKPSEKVPFTVTRMVEILMEAGLPQGVVSVIHGGKSVVSHLITHRLVSGVTFVGSSPIAELVYNTATKAGKRAICLGGAKNHLVLLPDADPEQSSTDILNSFAGSAGQRCMAASVLVLVANDAESTARVDAVLKRVIEKAAAVKPGQTGPGEIGPVIDQAAVDRINKYVSQSETTYSATVHVDGRSWIGSKPGFWFGPTVIEHTQVDKDPALKDEIFGPVISVIRVNTLQEAIHRVNRSEYGNAACIYTRSGPAADVFSRTVHPGMIGVNVGVPVPREPFSFGGTKRSKFGIGDITGDGLVEFGTIRRKITTKWGAASGTDFVAKNFTG